MMKWNKLVTPITCLLITHMVCSVGRSQPNLIKSCPPGYNPFTDSHDGHHFCDDVPDPPPAYESFNVVFYQPFFDNLSRNFIEPFIKSLPDRDLSDWDVINPPPLDLDVVTINYNLTNFRFLDTWYNGSAPIIDIEYDSYTLVIDGVNLTLAFDYEYVSDPPIFADIGTAKFGMTNWYLNLTGALTLVDDVWDTEISDINMGWKGEQPEPSLDGLSDFSETLTSMAMVF